MCWAFCEAQCGRDAPEKLKMSLSIWACSGCHNKISPSSSANRSLSSGVWKTKMPAGWVSLEASFLDLQVAAFLSWFFPSEGSSLVSQKPISFFIKTQSDWSSTHPNSLILILLLLLKALFPGTMTCWRLQHVDLGEHSWVPRVPWWLSDEEPTCQGRRCKRPRFSPRVGKTPGEGVQSPGGEDP